MPVLFLAFALAAGLAALRDRDIVPDNHDLRHLQPGLRARPAVKAAFLRFLDADSLPGEDPAPVVLVAASGGGIAAAYWTATVLGDLADASPGFAARVFAMSGVSGGALGLLTYAALGRGAQGCRDPAATPGRRAAGHPARLPAVRAERRFPRPGALGAIAVLPTVQTFPAWSGRGAAWRELGEARLDGK